MRTAPGRWRYERAAGALRADRGLRPAGRAAGAGRCGAVRGRGEIVGVIGETGSGKTTLARTAVGLVPARSGRVVFDGREISGLRGRALRAFRRSGRLSYAFQDPLRALDPELTVRRAVAEPLAVAGDLDGAEIAARVDEALETVGLDAARLGRPAAGGDLRRPAPAGAARAGDRDPAPAADRR
ncbi:ATP-binding cassette domain-containing protein [Streptomyces malaysiensis subsp. malaysiensis]